MAAKITRDTMERHLHCKTKAHLKLAGQRGSMSDYEGLLVARGGWRCGSGLFGQDSPLVTRRPRWRETSR